ncbi:MAG: nucleoside hydrolase [Treponema sp.]|jgi:hypothetical protein|nr:nucleoside hydrolase [Treponema sp.]
MQKKEKFKRKTNFTLVCKTSKVFTLFVLIALCLPLVLTGCDNPTEYTGVGAYDPYQHPAGVRAKVFMLNDSSGDPDGLTAVAHAVISKSTQLVGLVGTSAGSRPNSGPDTAKEKHDQILKMAGVTDVPSYLGAATALVDTNTPIRSDGALALVEAAKNFVPPTAPPDSSGSYGFYQKLFVTVGGSLTDVASAILIDPSIIPNITLVWIGGNDYINNRPGESNLMRDVNAANVVFGSDVEIWQVPSNAYGRSYVSMTEMRRDLYPYGELGKWLFESFVGIYGTGFNMGETWSLGDNPLVLLTALMGAYGLDTGSSTYHSEEARLFNADGSYNMANPNPNPNPRNIRVYDELDTRTMIADFFAKMQGMFPL